MQPPADPSTHKKESNRPRALQLQQWPPPPGIVSHGDSQLLMRSPLSAAHLNSRFPLAYSTAMSLPSPSPLRTPAVEMAVEDTLDALAKREPSSEVVQLGHGSSNGRVDLKPSPPWMLPRRLQRRRTMCLVSTWTITIIVGLALYCIYVYVYGYSVPRGPLLPTSHSEKGSQQHAMPSPSKPATSPNVTLPQGTYVGVSLGTSPRFPRALDAFRGIPFAQDTSGENRFRPPQPLPPSTDTYDAVRFGKVCPRGAFVGRNAGEDCLNANVYRPTGVEAGAKLPVIVYIHGGGFNGGQGTERNMASFIAWAEEPMIAINFNYRVGALGFLPSDVTAKAGLLNLGLRDQQMLLEWVRDNIALFGGDPDNVTIMGFSAGAHSVGHHIMHYSQSTKPAPFHKAIVESGATTARAVFYPNHPRHQSQFRDFLGAAGLSKVPDSELFDRLRSLPLARIVRASHVVWNKHSASVTWPFQPVIDGVANDATQHLPALIPDLPIRSWLQGNHLRIPILTGFNTNEGTVFIPTKANTNAEFRAFFKGLIPALTNDDLDELERLYPDPVSDPANSPYVRVPANAGRQWARLDAAYSHYAYICPVLQTAHFMSWSGQSDVYVYKYAADGAWGTANHGDQSPLVTHDMDFLGYGGARFPGLVGVADNMNWLWGRFVASPSGVSPNLTTAGGTEWPKFSSPFDKDGSPKQGREALERGRMVVFGEGNNERDKSGSAKWGKKKGVPIRTGTLEPLLLEACQFWWSRVGLSQGWGRMDGAGSEKARL